MTLKEQINADFMEAYKAKDMKKKDFLGVLKGTIQTQEGKQVESTDENILKVIKSMEKGINETIEAKVKLDETTFDQLMELEYLKPYLPTLMSEEQIRENVRQVIIETGETNMGKIMGAFNKKYAGQAFDNKVVSQIIKTELND